MTQSGHPCLCVCSFRSLSVSVSVAYRYERLEEQLNDLTELHQNEMSNLKQELASMEEKVAYQSYERARDVQVSQPSWPKPRLQRQLASLLFGLHRNAALCLTACVRACNSAGGSGIVSDAHHQAGATAAAAAGGAAGGC